MALQVSFLTCSHLRLFISFSTAPLGFVPPPSHDGPPPGSTRTADRQLGDYAREKGKTPADFGGTPNSTQLNSLRHNCKYAAKAWIVAGAVAPFCNLASLCKLDWRLPLRIPFEAQVSSRYQCSGKERRRFHIAPAPASSFSLFLATQMTGNRRKTPETRPPARAFGRSTDSSFNPNSSPNSQG